MKPVVREKALLLPIAVDSGAYTYYTKKGAPRTAEGERIRGFVGKVDHTYTEKPEFEAYLASYKKFVASYGDRFQYCVSLDVIGSEEKSYKIYKQMAKEGLKVLPVFHYGDDPKYLKLYMDSTDYVGLGGLVKTASKAHAEAFQNRTWKTLCDDKGRPLIKVHGFGVTSFDPMFRYPFYSVDSTTAFTWSRYGCVMMPQKEGPHANGFQYLNRSPNIFPVTEGRRRANTHIGHLRPDGASLAALNEYLATIDLTLEQVQLEYGARDIVNLHYMNSLMAALSKRHSKRLGLPFRMLYYASGNYSSTMPIFDKGVKHLKKRNQTAYLAYLGTFENLNPVQRLFRGWLGERIPTPKV